MDLRWLGLIWRRGIGRLEVGIGGPVYRGFEKLEVLEEIGVKHVLRHLFHHLSVLLHQLLLVLELHLFEHLVLVVLSSMRAIEAVVARVVRLRVVVLLLRREERHGVWVGILFVRIGLLEARANYFSPHGGE